jgi:WD40 repeat protein
VGRRGRQILRRLDRKGVDTSDAALNRARTLVATGWQSSALRLWNQDGTLLHTFHVPGPITLARFSPDGKFLAAGTGEGDRLGPGSVSIWNVHTYEPQGPPIPAASFGMGVEDIAFSRDSRIMAIAAETDSEIGTVRLRDVQTHAPLGAPIRGDIVAFSADGRSLLVGNYDSDTATRVRDILWHDFVDLRTRVCNLVWGNLTKDEWATYAPGLPAHKTC